MTYRKYVLWIRPTAECRNCGVKVRLRGFYWTHAVGVVVLAIWAFSRFDPVALFDPVAFLWLALPLLALDYASYRFLKWQPEGSDGAVDREEAVP